MRPHPEYERLNDQLHKHFARWPGNEQSDQSYSSLFLTEKDHEVDRLVVLARHLQAAPPLQVNPDFDRQLEQRMLLHHLALGRQSSGQARQTTKLLRYWFFSRPFVAYISMAVVLLCSLLGMGMFALAAHATNPGNPLYMVKQWENQVLAHSPSDQATVSPPTAQNQSNSSAKNNRNNKNHHPGKNNSDYRANANRQGRTRRNNETTSNGNNSHGYKNNQPRRSKKS